MTRALSLRVATALQRSIGNAAVGRLLGPTPTPAAADAPIQRYKSTSRGDGTVIGEPAAYHCHVDIGSPTSSSATTRGRGQLRS